MKNKLILILSITLFVFACKTSEKSAGNKNVAGIYMPGLNLIDPQYKVFHKNDSLTELHFRSFSDKSFMPKIYL